MEVVFQNRELQKLYETGKSRKFKLPQNIIEEYFTCVQSILSAMTIYDLWNDASLHFEKLKNSELYSMRLNIKYRLEMTIEWENEQCTIGIFGLTDITNHYE